MCFTRFLKVKWVVQNVLQNVLQKFLQNVLQIFSQNVFSACVHVRARAELGVHTRAHVSTFRIFGPIYHSASPYTSSCVCCLDHLNELALLWEKLPKEFLLRGTNKKKIQLAEISLVHFPWSGFCGRKGFLGVERPEQKTGVQLQIEPRPAVRDPPE